MTENSLSKQWQTLAWSLTIPVGASAAYVYQQGRAVAHTAHFGVDYGVADLRDSALPLALVTIIAVGLVVTMFALALGVAVLSVRGGVVLLAVLASLLPPYGTRPTSLRVVVVVASWLVIATALRVARWVDARGADLARRHSDHTVFRMMVQMSERMDRVPFRIAPVVIPVLLAGVVWGASLLGQADGRAQAAATADFDVIRRDAATATVIFTHSGDIVERVLDMSPGAHGAPRNVWLPGVVIRPMPEEGIRYERVHLGRTQRTSVATP